MVESAVATCFKRRAVLPRSARARAALGVRSIRKAAATKRSSSAWMLGRRKLIKIRRRNRRTRTKPLCHVGRLASPKAFPPPNGRA